MKETSTDPKGNVTGKVYDRAGRLWKVIADGKATTYSYHDNGIRQSVVFMTDKEKIIPTMMTTCNDP